MFSTLTVQIKLPRLPQSKLFLKIISISYLKKDTNKSIIANIVEKIIKDKHIFNNVILASRPRVIKVSPRLDMCGLTFGTLKVEQKPRAL